jgi:hypothetical protein
MEHAREIRDAIAKIGGIRTVTVANPELKLAVGAIKALQADRFAATYSDLLATDTDGPATRFFLADLYGTGNFEDRDRQFGRIADSLQSFFPGKVIITAVALAKLHLQTELLDYAMAQRWLVYAKQEDAANAYVACWRDVDATIERYRQLEAVVSIGQALEALTRTPGLRMTLRMMRGPARVSGLSALQTFLEKGFDAFAVVSRSSAGAAYFLDTIRTRECDWIDVLSNGKIQSAVSALEKSLGKTVKN